MKSVDQGNNRQTQNTRWSSRGATLFVVCFGGVINFLKMGGQLNGQQYEKLNPAYSSYASGLTGVDLFSHPIPWHEFFEAGHFVISNPSEDPTKPGFRIDAVHTTGLDERIGDGGSFTAPL